MHRVYFVVKKQTFLFANDSVLQVRSGVGVTSTVEIGWPLSHVEVDC